MTKLNVICIVLSYASLIICQQQGGGDLTDLINQVFSTENPNKENPSRGGDSNSGTDGGGGLNLDPNTNTGGSNTGSGIPGTDQCTCVPYYLCNNGSVNTNGEGVIDIRINEGPCGDYIDICCDKDKTTDDPILPTPKPEKQTGCGFRNPDGIAFRITGDNDNEAQYGEFPWMVAVLREETVQGSAQVLNVYQCGGALIHPRVVLTAAHCVVGRNKTFKIRAGEWDTQTKKELFPHQDRQVVRVVTHREYYAGALYNDVALLLLQTPVEIAENVNTICLPPQDANYDHSRCFASGWGKDVFGKEGKYQVILKKLDLPVVPRDKCLEELRKTRLGKHFELHSSFVCAGGEKGKDTCKGDGGSPLVCPIQGQRERYVQVGIVAWGIGCGETNTPGVYANVAKFRNWIETQMGLLDIRDKPYEYFNNYQPCAYSQFDVCCKKENIVKTAIPPSPEPYKHTECGHRNPDGIDSRIGQFNGSEAKYGEFPWMVAIMREEPIEGSTQVLNLYQCGGSLIHPRVVLTAAHCVTGKNKTFKIRAGEWDTQTKQELYPHQDRRVVRVISHNEYYSAALFNDVALLYLESPLEIAENINIVCLPTYDANYDFSRCFASGWGKDRFGKEGIYQVILKKIDLPIVPRGRCQEELRKTRLTEKFTLHSSFICAGGEKGKDTCIGDGGSPLVCPIPGQTGRYAQVGIVAWGIGCGSETPGVYGNVARFRNWIDTQMQSLNINERLYEHA